MRDKIYVQFILDGPGFPNGMASTQRAQLIGRSLVESGFNVNIMCVRASENVCQAENTKISGIFKGIYFEYATGVTIRPSTFWMRRFIDLKGAFVAIYRLFSYKIAGRLSCIYYYGNILSRSLNRWIFYITAQILRVPLVIEICERPWVLKRERVIDTFLHPLKSVDGVIVISNFLREWVVKEKRRLKNLKILELPILVDFEETENVPFNRDDGMCNIVFAGSPVYKLTIEFILDSMIIVWEKYPDANLIITGYREGIPELDLLRAQLQQRNVTDKVKIAGYLRRPDLLSLYQSASALLIPLANDVRSKARFPTKIGEYLCSSKPIVTNSVGEIPRYFQDKENAFICDPDEPNLYAKKIMTAIDPRNREFSKMVGINGLHLAKNVFYYKSHSRAISDFFESICL
jgi:glycosyltransferase involved in cell wall biosynthesis